MAIISRVSVASDGTQGNSWSGDTDDCPAISYDGRFIAFYSRATTLVPLDDSSLNAFSETAFVHDRILGETYLVSKTEAGDYAEVDGYAWWRYSSPAISGDGRTVVYQSRSSEIVTEDINNEIDVFFYDLDNDETDILPVAIDASTRIYAVYISTPSAVSFDGNDVVYQYADQLYAYSRRDGEVEPVTVSSAGVFSREGGFLPAVSKDARFIAFQTDAANLQLGDGNRTTDIYLRDRVAQTTERISISLEGSDTNGRSEEPSISADGRYIAFASNASNLVENDTNGQRDIFVQDRLSKKIELISVSSTGHQGSGQSDHPAISADGRFVVFDSSSSDLTEGDNNRRSDVFVHDRETGLTERVSIGADGFEGNSSSHLPNISGDGNFVTFVSEADNLVGFDTNDRADVFVVGNPLLQVSAPDPGPLPVTTQELEYHSRLTAYQRGELFRVDPDDPDGPPVPLRDVSVQLPGALPNGYVIDEVFPIDENAAADNPTFYAVGLIATDGTPVLAFRGTDGALDWLSNADLGGIGSSEVDGAWPELHAWLIDHPGAILTGHSQGGAQAQYAASRAVTGDSERSPIDTIAQIVTFNAPGINSEDAANWSRNAPPEAKVTHFISLGDVVSHAGEAHLDGSVRLYDLEHGRLDSPLEWFSPLTGAHIRHWSQSEIAGTLSGREVAPLSDPATHQTLDTVADTRTFNSPLYSHLNGGGKFDDDYFGMLLGVGAISAPVAALLTPLTPAAGLFGVSLASLPVSLATRGGTENLRQDVGVTLEVATLITKLGRALQDATLLVAETGIDALNALAQALAQAFDLTVDAVAATAKAIVDLGEAIQAGVATVAAWAERGAVAVTDWSVETWQGVSRWSAETWDALIDLSARKIEALASWGTEQWEAVQDFTAEQFSRLASLSDAIWEGILSWSADVIELVRDAPENLADFFRETVGGFFAGEDEAEYILGRDDGDQIEAAGGNDTLVGGAGDDDLDGGPGRDTMEGGAGDDIIRVDDRRDVVRGGEGVDTAVIAGRFRFDVSGTGVERIVGEAGAGRLFVVDDATATEMVGAEGDDILASGGGRDRMTGGEGADFFAFIRTGSASDATITEFDASDKLVLDDRFFGIGNASVDLRALDPFEVLGLLRDGLASYTPRTKELSVDIDGPDGPGGLQVIARFEGRPALGLDDVMLF